jgi:hypothetical protein
MLENGTEGTPSNGEAPFEFVEDAIGVIVEALAPLDDDALRRGGLVRVHGFVRTRQSAAAMRCTRHRERQKLDGRQQINITVPADEEARAAVKALARAMSAGTVSPAAVAALAAEKAGGSLAATSGPLPTSEAPDLVKPAQAQKEASVAASISQPAPSLMPSDPFAGDLERVRSVLVRGGWRASIIRRLARRGVASER